MLRFTLQKIFKKKWMMLALLIGNVLLIAITISNPMYTQAVLQRMLTRNLSNFMLDRNAYPGLVSVRTNANASRIDQLYEADEIVRSIPERFGVEAIEQVAVLTLNASKAQPELVRDDDRSGKSLTLGTMPGIEDHIRLTAGRIYQQLPDEAGVIDVIVSERGLLEMNLLMGEQIEMPNLLDENERPIQIRIAGVFSNSAADDPFWVRTPRAYSSQVFMSEANFSRHFLQEDRAQQRFPVNAQWFVLLDYTQMRGDEADHMLAAHQELTEYFSQSYSNHYSTNFSAILSDYQIEARKVTVTLWILQVPIFVLLAAFIFMVSRQILETEQNEISVIKSRGSSKKQLIGLYLIQSAMLALLSLAAGIPLGVYLCQVLGSSNAFLEFVKRQALTLEFTGETLAYALAAALFSMAAMVLPVFKYANVTIVAHKQKKSARRAAMPWWQKSFLDVACLGVGLYGLYNFNNQRDALVQSVAAGEALDWLLYLSSSLFMIGAGLLALRVLPAVVWLVFMLFRRLWSPALYASFLRVIRTRSSQGFITVFLILTIAMGIFNAQAARTINSNKEDNIRYLAGADIAVQEVWANNAQSMGGGPGQPTGDVDLQYFEPDYGKYAPLLDRGVTGMTKVLRTDDISLSVSGGGLIKQVQLMGIHTREFGQIAWFNDALLPHHFYEYLNAMAHNARAVLVSKNLQTNYGYRLGDAIYYKNNQGDSMRGVIYGFVDYWPGFAPVKYTRGSDGIYRETEQFLIVAHLAQLQSSWGVTPYWIWMNLDGSSQVIYDFAGESDLQFQHFTDASADIVALKNNPVFQGTNGILTVGFIVVLLLCAVGFLIYWILSIQSRALQFGIYRAMGMSLREIFSMLINEQIFISGLAILVGVVVGRLAGRLYIPLIQIAYTAVDQAVPVAVTGAQSDMIRLMGAVGAMILICMVILGVIIGHLKIAQALKLGED